MRHWQSTAMPFGACVTTGPSASRSTVYGWLPYTAANAGLQGNRDAAVNRERSNHPAEPRAVRAHGGGDVERRALARAQLERELASPSLGGEPGDIRQEAAAVLAHEYTHRLADEKTLADIEQLGADAVHLGDDRRGLGDHIGLRHLFEQLPVTLA